MKFDNVCNFHVYGSDSPNPIWKSVELLEEQGLELQLLANTKQKIEMSYQDEKKTYVQDVIEL